MKPIQKRVVGSAIVTCAVAASVIVFGRAIEPAVLETDGTEIDSKSASSDTAIAVDQSDVFIFCNGILTRLDKKSLAVKHAVKLNDVLRMKSNSLQPAVSE